VSGAFSSFAGRFVEWWTAVGTGEAATAFLGTQGDPWDTQWDMFCALIGATVSVLVLSRLHDRQLDALDVTPYGGAGSTAAPRTSTARTTRPHP
jgi:putative membrane protein